MRKLTLTVDDDVYEGLHAVVGAGRISRFVNDLVRPLVSEQALLEGYRAMVADKDREAQAQEWCDALIADAGSEP
jgi:hypothetical protein